MHRCLGSFDLRDYPTHPVSNLYSLGPCDLVLKSGINLSATQKAMKNCQLLTLTLHFIVDFLHPQKCPFLRPDCICQIALPYPVHTLR